MALALSCPTRSKAPLADFPLVLDKPEEHQKYETSTSCALFLFHLLLSVCGLISDATFYRPLLRLPISTYDFALSKIAKTSRQENSVHRQISVLLFIQPASQTRLGRSSYACCVCRGRPKAPAATRFDRVSKIHLRWFLHSVVQRTYRIDLAFESTV